MSDVEEFTTEETAALQEIEAKTEPVDIGDDDMSTGDLAPEKATKAADADADDSDQDDGGDGEKKGDPGIALQQARQQARQSREAQRKLEAQLEQQRSNYEQLAQRISEIATARQGPQSPGQPRQQQNPLEALNQQLVDEPDPFDDPEGFQAAKAHNKRVLDAQQSFIRQIMTQQAQTQQATEQQRRAQHLEQQIAQIGVQHMQDFMIEAPDYQEAEAFLIESRKAEYAAAGYQPQEIDQAISSEYRNFILRAHNQGGNAAQIAYGMAKARGWQPGMQVGGNQADPVATAQQGLQAKASAANKARSLGAAGGARNGGGVTAEKLASLSFDEIADYNDAEFLKAIGV